MRYLAAAMIFLFTLFFPISLFACVEYCCVGRQIKESALGQAHRYRRIVYFLKLNIFQEFSDASPAALLHFLACKGLSIHGPVRLDNGAVMRDDVVSCCPRHVVWLSYATSRHNGGTAETGLMRFQIYNINVPAIPNFISSFHIGSTKHYLLCISTYQYSTR